LGGLNRAINRAEDNVGHATEEVNRQAAVVQQREQELSTSQNELTKLKEENNVKEIEVKQQQEYISKLKKIEKIFCAFSERRKNLCLASWRFVLPSTPILPDEPFNCCSMSLMVFNRGSRENKDFASSRKIFVLPKVVEI
jgi:hypothetical protein